MFVGTRTPLCAVFSILTQFRFHDASLMRATWYQLSTLTGTSKTISLADWLARKMAGSQFALRSQVERSPISRKLLTHTLVCRHFSNHFKIFLVSQPRPVSDSDPGSESDRIMRVCNRDRLGSKITAHFRIGSDQIVQGQDRIGSDRWDRNTF